MDRVLRLWSAVSWWLVPLAIIALGAVDMAQNGSLSSAASNATFPGPVVAHAAFLLLVTVPLCWRFRAPVAVAILVTACSGIWIVTMFKRARPSLRSSRRWRSCGRVRPGQPRGRPPLRTGLAVSAGLFAVGEIRGELAGQGIGNVFPAMLFFVLIFVLGRMVYAHRRRAVGPAEPRRQAGA